MLLNLMKGIEMRNAIVHAGRWFVILAGAMTIASCAEYDAKVTSRSPTLHVEAADSNLRSYGLYEQEAETFRTKKDPSRNRLWVLSWDAVRVYDSATKTLLRQIVLPMWSVSAFLCPPDLVLDQTGSALIASNSHPVIFRVDAESFSISTLEIALTGREQWDMGFGALTFAQNGALFALTSVGNALWKIDVATARAKLVRLYDPPMVECILSPAAISE